MSVGRQRVLVFDSGSGGFNAGIDAALAAADTAMS